MKRLLVLSLLVPLGGCGGTQALPHTAYRRTLLGALTVIGRGNNIMDPVWSGRTTRREAASSFAGAHAILAREAPVLAHLRPPPAFAGATADIRAANTLLLAASGEGMRSVKAYNIGTYDQAAGKAEQAVSHIDAAFAALNGGG